MSRHKLTLSLPPEVITKAKILAAQRKISLSALFVYAHDHSNPSKQAKVRERVVIQRPV